MYQHLFDMAFTEAELASYQPCLGLVFVTTSAFFFLVFFLLFYI
jgi:hypothetical protein